MDAQSLPICMLSQHIWESHSLPLRLELVLNRKYPASLGLAADLQKAHGLKNLNEQVCVDFLVMHEGKIVWC